MRPDPPPRAPRSEPFGSSWGAIALVYILMAIAGVAVAYAVNQ